MSKFEIAPKEDDPQRLLELNGVPAKFWLSAQEINQFIKSIAGLLGKETDLYKGEYGSIEELEAAHPLPEPGSEAQIIVVDGDNLKASWDNTNKKWFLDGVYVDPSTSAAYLLRSVFDSNGDGIIDFDNLPPLSGASSPNAVLKFVLGHTGGLNFIPYSKFTINNAVFEDSRLLSADPADPNLPRYDSFAIDISNKQLVILKGTADANRTTPVVDPLTHLETGVVIDIPAGATEPSGITGVVVYSEGVEWSVQYDVNYFDIDNPENPASGAVAIKTLQPHTQNKALGFTPEQPLIASQDMELQYKIANIVGGDHYWIVQGFDTKGKIKSIGINVPAYDPSTTNYQFLSLSIPNGILVDIRQIMLVSLSNDLQFYIDEVRLSSGGGALDSGVSKEFVLAEDKKLQDQIDDHEDRIEALEGGSTTSPSGHVEKKYATVAAMLADQANQTEGALQFVTDASGWSTVTSGWAEFEKLAASTGSESDYRKDAEEESMDVAASGGGGPVVSSIIPVTQNYLLTPASNNAIIRVKDYASVIIPTGLGLKHRNVIKKATGKSVSLTPGENVTLETPEGYLAEVLAQNDAIEIVLEEISGGIEYWGVYGALAQSEYSLPLTLNVSQTSAETGSVIFPSIYKSSDYPEITTVKPYFMVYSSDHADTNGGGIYWAEMDDPEGKGFIERGALATGNQAESPFLMRKAVADGGLGVYLFYHTGTTDPANVSGKQETHLITTPGGAEFHLCTFTDRGKPLGLIGDEDHTGYMTIFQKADNTYVAHHVTRSDQHPTNPTTLGVSTSPDLLTWTRQTSATTQTQGMPAGLTYGWRTRIFPFKIGTVQYGVVGYFGNGEGDKLGIMELDGDFLPLTYIRELVAYQAYDGKVYEENGVLYFFVYLDGSDGTGGSDTGNVFLYKYAIPDTI